MPPGSLGRRCPAGPDLSWRRGPVPSSRPTSIHTRGDGRPSLSAVPMTKSRLRADFERHLPPGLAREVVDGVRYRGAAADLSNDTRGIVLGGWAPSNREPRQGTARNV